MELPLRGAQARGQRVVGEGRERRVRLAQNALLAAAGVTDLRKNLGGDLHWHDYRHECGSRDELPVIQPDLQLDDRCGAQALQARFYWSKMVPRGRVELPTPRFSVVCSTN